MPIQTNKFLQKIVKESVIWYLHKNEGCAMSASKNSDLNVYLFWDSKSAAQKCAVNEWSDYEPKKIKLVEFLEVWCIPLYEQEVLMGTNWTTELIGEEYHPLQLLKDLIHEIRLQNKEEKLKLLLFEDLCEIELAIAEVY